MILTGLVAETEGGGIDKTIKTEDDNIKRVCRVAAQTTMSLLHHASLTKRVTSASREAPPVEGKPCGLRERNSRRTPSNQPLKPSSSRSGEHRQSRRDAVVATASLLRDAVDERARQCNDARYSEEQRASHSMDQLRRAAHETTTSTGVGAASGYSAAEQFHQTYASLLDSAAAISREGEHLDNIDAADREIARLSAVVEMEKLQLEEAERENAALLLFVRRHSDGDGRETRRDKPLSKLHCEGWRSHLRQLLRDVQVSAVPTAVCSAASQSQKWNRRNEGNAGWLTQQISTNTALLQECAILEEEVDRIKLEVMPFVGSAAMSASRGGIPWSFVDSVILPRYRSMLTEASSARRVAYPPAEAWLQCDETLRFWEAAADHHAKVVWPAVREDLANAHSGLQLQLTMVLSHLASGADNLNMNFAQGTSGW